jgi:hypothetical protein
MLTGAQGSAANGGNGHYYEFISLNSWTAANAEAEPCGEYLSTITSTAEQAFVQSAMPSGGNFWLGDLLESLLHESLEGVG